MTGSGVVDAASVDVDVYLDATTSMEGYVGRSTEYGTFLYDLEAALSSRWREADVQFFRFGTRVDSITRDAYLQAREDLRFYKQRGIFERTNIDSVLARAAADRVSVIVTDLFQDDGDTNELVRRIKDRVFVRDLSVGVLGVESQFDGRIYDAPGGPYAYASTAGDRSTYRPFYALLIGQPAYLERLFRTVEGSDVVRAERFVLISPYVVGRSELRLEQPRLFTEGRYIPLAVTGDQPGSLIAFARELDGNWVLVIAARLAAGLLGDAPAPSIPAERWGDTRISLPDALNGVAFTRLFGADTVTPKQATLHVHEALQTLPVAVLQNTISS